jgi:hypothetical protein
VKKHLLLLILALGLLMTGCAAGGSTEQPASDPDTESVGSGESTGSVRDILGEVALLTGESGLGEKPLLQWSDVDGAVEYSVVVRDENGQVYWSWRGAETEVPFGGGADDGQPGQNAYLHGMMSWTVVAYDITQLPIAISSQGNLTP